MVQAARPGRMVVAPSVLRTSPRQADVADLSGSTLTGRELEVLGFIGQGLQAKTIAKLRGLSLHTCRGYIKSTYTKLHVNNRIAAVNRGRELNLLGA